MQHSATLRRNQARAALALLCASTIEEAAREAGVNRSTLWRWSKEPQSQQAMADARREAFQMATNRLAAACQGATETLQAICLDQSVAPSVRVSAAGAVLDHARRAMELDDVAARLHHIETCLGDSPK